MGRLPALRRSQRYGSEISVVGAKRSPIPSRNSRLDGCALTTSRPVGIEEGVKRINISSDGQWLSTTSADGVRLWPLALYPKNTNDEWTVE